MDGRTGGDHWSEKKREKIWKGEKKRGRGAQSVVRDNQKIFPPRAGRVLCKTPKGPNMVRKLTQSHGWRVTQNVVQIG